MKYLAIVEKREKCGVAPPSWKALGEAKPHPKLSAPALFPKTRRQFTNARLLQLVAKREADNSWVKRTDVITLPSLYGDRYHEGVLLLVELDPNRQITKIQPAAGEIVKLLLDLKQQWDEIQLWRDSLEQQRVEIEQRSSSV